MATPTPSQLAAVPSPASRKAAMHNNVSTPGAYNLSSPAPRSVPSPATTRKDQAGKTPVGYTTGSTGSKTAGGTPMVPNLSQHSTASPMPAGVSGVTPTGLGVDLGTPGLGAVMMPTMSELGLTVSGGIKRNEDEERRTKMRKIIKTIGRVKGRVSEESIARMSRRVGFANDIDAEKLTAEERERRVGNRTISIAGNTIVIDVNLKEHIPRNVQVMYSNEMSNTNGNADRAAKILLDDLSAGRAPQINTMLNKFAVNLERLAKLDRLSTKTNCFDALSGVYASLKRLYEQEIKLAAVLEVVNKRSGRPALHEDTTLGLSVTYHESVSTAHKLWIETERCPSGMFPSVRISNTWLPDPLELSKDEPIPWQEAPAHFGLEPEDETNIQAGPDVRFVVKFDPPIVMPWQVAANIYTSTGSTIPPAFQLPTYINLLLNSAPHSLPLNNVTTKVKVVSSNGQQSSEHVYDINIAKHDVGYTLEELPFSHPRQIIDLLPILRQWQAFNEVLTAQLDAVHAVPDASSQSTLSALLDDAQTSSETGVECSVTTSPIPALSLVFATHDGKLCNADLQMLPNGELQLGNDIPGNSKAKKALRACGDVTVWVEWIRLYTKS